MKFYLSILTLLIGGIGLAQTKPVETVPHVDLSKYLGVWYEIASYPGPHQEGCVATKATYALRADGDIDVTNECHDKTFDGKLRSAKGKAWVTDKVTQAKLKVRFFWPFSADYWVIQLGDQYEYAVVSGPQRKYLWILSRTRQLPKTTYDAILKRLSESDFDLSRLKPTPQPATDR